MIRIFLPLTCAALGLATASCSQSEGPFAPTEAPASPRAASHGAASAAMESPPDAPQAQGTADTPAPADAPASIPERRASTVIGMPVVAADGSPLGEVKDIIFDSQGRATHLVIAFEALPQAGPAEIPEGNPEATSGGKLAALPWDTARASTRDGHLVLDGVKLESAPSFTSDEWPNLDDPAWSATADAYWRKVGGPAVAGRPGAPVDSTARLRARPARDGDGP